MNKKQVILTLLNFLLITNKVLADGIGSGFVVHPDGYILTNHHVIADARSITVHLPSGQDYPAQIIADDDYKDLALLKIAASELPTVSIGDSDRVRLLDYILVLGYPYASLMGTQVSVYDGKVNAIRDQEKIPLFQVDANINTGNSGGPVVNERGEVIGVVVSKLDAVAISKKSGTLPERINFVIPIKFANSLLQRPYPLGVPIKKSNISRTPQEIAEKVSQATVLILAQATAPAPTTVAPKLKTYSKLIADRYRDNGDGTVTDVTTKLMWKRCAEGQTWNGETCLGEDKNMTWYEAMPNERQKHWPAFAGHNDWQVPVIDELKTLIYCSSGEPQTWNTTGELCEGDYSRPTIVRAAFPNNSNNSFWASSPFAYDSNYAWYVNFGHGYVGLGNKYYTNQVRLVRSGQ